MAGAASQAAKSGNANVSWAGCPTAISRPAATATAGAIHSVA